MLSNVQRASLMSVLLHRTNEHFRLMKTFRYELLSSDAKFPRDAEIEAMMKDNPDLSYAFVRQAITAKAEIEAGKSESYEFG